MNDKSKPNKLKLIIELLYGEILNVRHYEEVWRHLNTELPNRNYGIIHEAVTAWYLSYQAAAIRRITATNSHDKLNLPVLIRLLQIDPGTSGQEELNVDLEVLSDATKKVSRWADEVVAHLTDPARHSSPPTFDDLKVAISIVGAFLTKYYLIVTGSLLSDSRPFILDNWKLR